MRLIIGILIVLLIFWFIRPSNQLRHQYKDPNQSLKKISKKTFQNDPTMSIFVPYWNVLTHEMIDNPINNSPISKLYYFGVTITKDGDLDKSDVGFVNLEKFNARQIKANGRKPILVVRLIDQNIIDSLFENKSIAIKASGQIANLATDMGFSGILVDLEYSALPTLKTRNSITGVISAFVSSARQNNLEIGMTLYGDSFYRGRPYDIKKLGEIADEIVIMAYDFHKSKSLPGPLFPFDENGYGYSFKKMVDDFSKNVSPDKLSIAYGMYGYQWETDKQKRPIKRGSAIPMRNVLPLQDKCYLPDCNKTVNSNSAELAIVRKIDNGFLITHSETPQSIETKIEFAKKYIVSSSILWISGYW